jgi:hypothetical protein
MALKPGEQIDESTGDLLFSSTAREFRTDLLLSREITSRTFSFYYPRMRPHATPRCAIVSSTNARYEDWADLSDEDYEASKRDLIETTLDALEKYVPVAASGSRTSRRPRRGPSSIIPNIWPAPVSEPSSKAGGQPVAARTGRRIVPRRQRRDHHVRLAGSHQLRSDRRQRYRCPADVRRRESPPLNSTGQGGT